MLLVLKLETKYFTHNPNHCLAEIVYITLFDDWSRHNCIVCWIIAGTHNQEEHTDCIFKLLISIWLIRGSPYSAYGLRVWRFVGTGIQETEHTDCIVNLLVYSLASSEKTCSYRLRQIWFLRLIQTFIYIVTRMHNIKIFSNYREMKTPKSKTALRLMKTVASSCKIWFTCNGHLICTR